MGKEPRVNDETPLAIEVGKTYRGKRRRRHSQDASTGEPLYNDRYVLWVSDDGQTVQYDSLTVAHGGFYPRVSLESFRAWALSEVDDD